MLFTTDRTRRPIAEWDFEDYYLLPPDVREARKREEEIWQEVQWRAATPAGKPPELYETQFEDARHPFAPTGCITDGGRVLTLDEMRNLEIQLLPKDEGAGWESRTETLYEIEINRLSFVIEGALERIQAEHGLETRAALASFLHVGKNAPAEWERHPERITASAARKICEHINTKPEVLRSHRLQSEAEELEMLDEAGREERRRHTERLHADELAYIYDRLSFEQQATITAIVSQMCLASRYADVTCRAETLPDD